MYGDISLCTTSNVLPYIPQHKSMQIPSFTKGFLVHPRQVTHDLHCQPPQRVLAQHPEYQKENIVLKSSNNDQTYWKKVCTYKNPQAQKEGVQMSYHAGNHDRRQPVAIELGPFQIFQLSFWRNSRFRSHFHFFLGAAAESESGNIPSTPSRLFVQRSAGWLLHQHGRSKKQ